MITLFWLCALIAVIGTVSYRRLSLPLVTGSLYGYLVLLSVFSPLGGFSLTVLWLVSTVVAVLFNHPSTRQQFVTGPIFQLFKKMTPSMSATEKEALAAGDVSWEAEIFSGKPNWHKFTELPTPKITTEEQAFLDNEVQELVNLTNDWDITHKLMDLPESIWQFLREKGFFGLIIPKEYGGKGFGAVAHSEILSKLVSSGITVSSTVSVPNSLGPAELLLHYGTQEQKDYYLPRLADGRDIPCFALTGPNAGSDAGSIPDTGIICKGEFEGKEIVGIRLNFDKRYITLAPVATVIGLAFKLKDPDNLLSDKTERGITCALIPSTTPGVTKGRRHFALNTPFQNGPIKGEDVFIPIDSVIGGEQMIGRGWQMLVECLSAGRAISLPSSAAGGTKAAALATGAYARVRRQFNCYIGQFEGIQEVLARIGGNAYVSEAGRLMTTALIDEGLKPSVASAILKYHTTERGQQAAKDAVDVHGGKAICMGPNNYIARGYQGAPIGITVEGANILTRNMIIYGQGAIRCHPHVLDELRSTEMTDKADALNLFDRAFIGHLGFVASNKVRAFVLGLTNGKLVRVSAHSQVQAYYQQISRYSAALAFLSDMSMFTLGGNLKRREKLSARLGDMLSLLYLGSAVLKHFKEQGEHAVDLPLVHWCMQDILYNVQEAADGLLKNFPNKFLRFSLRMVIFPLGKRQSRPSDTLDTQVSDILTTPCSSRERLGGDIGTLKNPNHPVYELEKTFQAVVVSEPIEKKITEAVKQGQIEQTGLEKQVVQAVALGLLNDAEAELVLSTKVLRDKVIAVDDFSDAELRPGSQSTAEEENQSNPDGPKLSVV